MESVCGYTLKDNNNLAISVENPVNDEDFLYFTLPADRKYSYFEIYNAAGTKTVSGTNFSKIHVYAYSGAETIALTVQ